MRSLKLNERRGNKVESRYLDSYTVNGLRRSETGAPPQSRFPNVAISANPVAARIVRRFTSAATSKMNFFAQRSQLRDLYDKVAAAERISSFARRDFFCSI